MLEDSGAAYLLFRAGLRVSAKRIELLAEIFG